jgi:ABC-type thiamin/hydroxymethylpyrimidine transport system permease subunit
MTTLAASTLASIAAWLIDRVLDGHVSETASYVVSFVVWAIVFVPSFVWIKRLREGA